MATIGIYEPTSFTWVTGDTIGDGVNSGGEGILYGLPHTAGANEKVTKVRALADQSYQAATAGFVRICLIAGISDPAPIERFVEFTNLPEISGTGYQMVEADVDWPLTEGVTYVLANFISDEGGMGSVDVATSASERFVFSAEPPEVGGTVSPDGYTGQRTSFIGALVESAVVVPDYTVRKGATGVEITHTLTADGITSQTLDGEVVTLVSQAGQVATIDFDETVILTSGELDLVLGDGTDTETLTVQYNVIGLPSSIVARNGIPKSEVSVEVCVLSGAEGSRVLHSQSTLATDADGNLSDAVVGTLALGETVLVSHLTELGGVAYEVDLELL